MLVGINLLREGLDIPEVSLVAILDADKEGFLRSQVSLIQTIGRAARNVDGRVHHVRRHDDRLDAAGDRRDDAAARAASRPTTGSTASRPQAVKKAILDLSDVLYRSDSMSAAQRLAEDELLTAEEVTRS